MQWQERLGMMNGFIRKNAMAILVALFFMLEAVSIGVSVQGAAPAPAPQDLLIRRGAPVEEPATMPARIPKLSEMRGPHIDDEAAAVVLEESSPAVSAAMVCQTLPPGLWVLLLLAYIAIMAANLAYGFIRPSAVPRVQWVGELIYTTAFVGMWYAWDGCASYAWYPLAIVRSGLLLYVAYLYFYDRRRERRW